MQLVFFVCNAVLKVTILVVFFLGILSELLGISFHFQLIASQLVSNFNHLSANIDDVTNGRFLLLLEQSHLLCQFLILLVLLAHLPLVHYFESMLSLGQFSDLFLQILVFVLLFILHVLD